MQDTTPEAGERASEASGPAAPDVESVDGARRSGARTGLHRRKKSLRRTLGKALVKRIGPQVVGAWARSWRLTTFGEEHFQRVLREHGGGCFATLWHGRMLLPVAYHARQDYHVLVSPSRDGDVSEEMLQRFGYRVIRGSSSRGGARALREMLGVLRAGGALVITPDGPRGPRHSMNPGLAWMARATGFPILPCGFACDRAWTLDSWDRFTIPKWRARVAFVYGEPIHVAREAGEEDMARATEAVRTAMLDAERRGFAELGAEPDW
jgi:lysophospholipid acyltransferase (LPLAT)-like uncharacterized protein